MTIPVTEVEREMEAAMSEGVTLLGRRFRAAATTTFEHDCFNTKQMRECGLLTVSQRFDPLRDDIGNVAGAIIIEAYASGKLFKLLAGVLVEDNVPWTVEGAEANAAFFAQLSDPRAKLDLRNFIPWAILNFFLNADDSWRTFLKYSSVGQRLGSSSESSPPSDHGAGSMTTATGTTS